jgi:hypothetical protein
MVYALCCCHLRNGPCDNRPTGSSSQRDKGQRMVQLADGHQDYRPPSSSTTTKGTTTTTQHHGGHAGHVLSMPLANTCTAARRAAVQSSAEHSSVSSIQFEWKRSACGGTNARHEKNQMTLYGIYGITNPNMEAIPTGYVHTSHNNNRPP